MKTAFNLCSAGVSGMIAAAVMAAPAVLLTLHQYGWKGLAAGLLLSGAGVSLFERARNKRAETRKANPACVRIREDVLNEFYARDTNYLQRTQKLCDELAPQFGFANIKIRVTEMSAASAHTLEHINLHALLFEKINLNDNEFKFVIAHELDHLRSHDHAAFMAVVLAHSLTAIAFVASSIDLFSGQPLHMNALPSYTQTVLAQVGTSASLILASFQMLRANELRSDSNATKATRDPEAGISSVKKINAYFCGEAKADSKWRLRDIIRTHPKTATRLQNIRETGVRLRAA